MLYLNLILKEFFRTVKTDGKTLFSMVLLLV